MLRKTHVIVAALALGLACEAHGFAPRARGMLSRGPGAGAAAARARLPRLASSPMPEEPRDAQGFTQKQRLREETEAPFRTARFFAYLGVGSAAGVGAFFSFTQTLAASLGARPDLDLNASLTNLGINVAGVVASAALWVADSKSQEKRLQRLAKGQQLSALKLRVALEGRSIVLKLAELRRNRSALDRRVVIYAGSEENVKEAVRGVVENEKSVRACDLLLAPIIVDLKAAGSAMSVREADVEGAAEAAAKGLVGLPFMLAEWQGVIGDEIGKALEQEVDVSRDGVAIILKKNGRVGTRSVGVPSWAALTGDVVQRDELGLDTKNI